jgi:histone H3/H4
MARANQARKHSRKHFPGKGRKLGGKKKQNPIKHIKAEQNSSDRILNGHRMSKIASDIIGMIASQQPRSTRRNRVIPVTRKQKSAVNNLTDVAQDMMIDKMNSAQMAAIHAKRITMLPKDMQLVDKILG